jgi:hypothetical protein
MKAWASCGLLCALAACAHAGVQRAPCAGGLDGSFVQLGPKDMQRDAADWQRRLQLLKQVGATTIVVQYTGDDQGSYDTRKPGATPVASLLTAADALDMPVYLGLYDSSAWPQAARSHLGRERGGLARGAVQRARGVLRLVSPGRDRRAHLGRRGRRRVPA